MIKTLTFNTEEVAIDTSHLMLESWVGPLGHILDSTYFAGLMVLLNKLYTSKDTRDNLEPQVVDDIFAPFNNIDLKDVRVIIIGGEPVKNSNGLLFGTDLYKPTDYSDELKEHTEYFMIKNSNTMLDSSLVDFADNGVLMLNACPLKYEGKSNLFFPAFRAFTASVISVVLKHNPNVIVVSTTNPSRALIAAAGVPESQVIISNGYFKVRDKIGQSIYEAINEKLEEPIAFW